MVLTSHSILIAALWFTSADGVTLAETPRFQDYPATVLSIKKPVRLRITDPESRRYRTQLLQASQRQIDFAGHFILATWGCGASCVMAAAIDAKTGEVTSFPFTVSGWLSNVTEPLEYRRESRLIVIRGSRNEQGSGTYYYEFVSHSFRLVGESSQ